mmetsp:Transcript_1542/g.3024  ORF Transcript_1542/g.3024 Transcript_1542/m.3024 type:complete len:297 (-) Transcript_1542:1505-2395(-)
MTGSRASPRTWVHLLISIVSNAAKIVHSFRSASVLIDLKLYAAFSSRVKTCLFEVFLLDPISTLVLSSFLVSSSTLSVSISFPLSSPLSLSLSWTSASISTSLASPSSPSSFSEASTSSSEFSSTASSSSRRASPFESTLIASPCSNTAKTTAMIWSRYSTVSVPRDLIRLSTDSTNDAMRGNGIEPISKASIAERGSSAGTSKLTPLGNARKTRSNIGRASSASLTPEKKLNTIALRPSGVRESLFDLRFLETTCENKSLARTGRSPRRWLSSIRLMFIVVMASRNVLSFARASS